MQFRVPDHPEVDLALRGGDVTPRHRRALRCGVCGAILEPWEEGYVWRDGARREQVCADCFDLLVASLDREELAERLGVEPLGPRT